MESFKPRISIGVPAYNSQEFIHKRLDSILSQTFGDFEIIISDNASTDKTPLICRDYASKDKRIKYYRQEKNMGLLWNFNFVLQKANSEFFVWASVDDKWDKSFLAKNIKVLESNLSVVGSLGKIIPYSPSSNLKPVLGWKNSLKIKFPIVLRLKKLLWMIAFPLGPTGIFSISGPYEKKVRFYFKQSSCGISYAVFRREKLRQGFVFESFLGSFWATNLSMLRFGNIHVIDEVLMYKWTKGLSSTDIVSMAKTFNRGVSGVIFPWLQFTSWCAKNLGINIFLKNIDIFIILNYIGFTAILKKLLFKS